ncbi:MAG: SdrD B-like domain-containing protein, partial [Chloroflexota bacterium]
GGSCAHSSGSGAEINETVDLPSGASATYIIMGTISPSAVGTLTSTATVAAPAGVNDPALENNSSTAASLLTPDVTLAVSKRGSPDPGLAPGHGVTYAIVVRNTGLSDAAPVSVSDLLPAALTGSVWMCTAGSGSSCSAHGSGDITDSAAIRAGGRITYTLHAIVDPGAAAGTTIENSASAAYGSTTVEGSESLLLVPITSLAADLDALDASGASSRLLPFVDADSSGGISPGDTLQYQAVIRNTGSDSAYQVRYLNTPDANTTLLPSSLTCDPACSVVSGGALGDAAVSVLFDSLSSGGSVTVTYQVTVNSSLPFQLAALSSQGKVSSANTASVSTDDPTTSAESGDPTTVTLTTGVVSGLVWRDDNGSSAQDEGEPALANIQVTLYYAGANNIWGDADDQVAQSLSDALGVYRFSNLPPGTNAYQVGFSAPAGYLFSPQTGDSRPDPTSGLTPLLSLTSNQQYGEMNAGLSSGLDFGSLPAVYRSSTLADDGARHVVTDTLYLGQTVLPDGDGMAGFPSDNDGIRRATEDLWTRGLEVTLTVTATGSGRLYAWFDWNNNSSLLDPGEAVDLGLVTDGGQTKSFQVGDAYTTTQTIYARFRLYPADYAQEFAPYGVVFGGEVEDYSWVNSPTAVTMASFKLEAAPQSGLLLRWETAAELDLAGFNVYRQLDGDQWLKLNPALILPGADDALIGAAYAWSDAGVQTRKPYAYRLEVVEIDGTQHWYTLYWSPPNLSIFLPLIRR